MSATKSLCVKTFSGKVVVESFPFNAQSTRIQQWPAFDSSAISLPHRLAVTALPFLLWITA